MKIKILSLAAREHSAVWELKVTGMKVVIQGQNPEGAGSIFQIPEGKGRRGLRG